MEINLYSSQQSSKAQSKEGSGKKADKIIRWSLYLAVFLIPLLFFPWTFNVLEFNKQALLIVLTVVAYLAWLAKILATGKIEFRKTLFHIPVLVFVLIYLLSTIFSLDGYGSFAGLGSRLGISLASLICFVLLYFVLINNFSRKHLLNLSYAFLGSSFLVLIFGLVQMLGGFIFPWGFTKSKAFNTIGSFNSFGIFISTALILAAGLLAYIGKKVNKIKIPLIVFSVLSLIALIFVNFWPIWVGLIVAMVFFLALAIVRAKTEEITTHNLMLPMAILIISIFLLIFKLPLASSLNIPGEVSLSYQASWEIARDTIKDRPILGSGPATFIFDYSKYRSVDINQTSFWNIRFNDSLSKITTYLATIGILGILSWLFLIISFIYLIIKGLSKEYSALGLGLASGWVFLLVLGFLYPTNLTLEFVFWILMAGFLVSLPDLTKSSKINLSPESSPRAALTVSFVAILIAVLAVSLLFMQGQRYAAAAYFKKATVVSQTEGNLDRAIDLMFKTTRLNQSEDVYNRTLAQALLLKINQEVQQEMTEERSQRIQYLISEAVNRAKQTTDSSAHNVENWAVLGSVYQNIMPSAPGADAWAINAFKRAIELEPTNPFLVTELGKVYLTAANLTEDEGQIKEYTSLAEEQFNRAVELKKDYSPAHFQLALVYDRQGNLKRAIEKQESNKQFSPNDVGITFQLGLFYYRDEQWDEAAAELERTIELSPNYSNARYFLGLVYDKQGRTDKAIEQFEKIAELNPTNQEIKNILENLEAGKPALGSAELGPPEQPEEIPVEEGKPEEVSSPELEPEE